MADKLNAGHSAECPAPFFRVIDRVFSLLSKRIDLL